MRKVRFMVSMNTQGASKEELFTLEQLGIEENESDEKLEEALQESYNEWLWDNIYGGFEFED